MLRAQTEQWHHPRRAVIEHSNLLFVLLQKNSISCCVLRWVLLHEDKIQYLCALAQECNLLLPAFAEKYEQFLCAITAEYNLLLGAISEQYNFLLYAQNRTTASPATCSN